MNIKLNKKFFTILFLFLIIITTSFLFACNKKSTDEGEYQLEEEDSIDIVVGGNSNTIDWEAEREKLKDVGQIKNVKDFCTIMVLWRKELDSQGYNLLSNFTEEQKASIEKLKISFFSYFGITANQYEDYANANKNAIDQFILSNPAYQEALISIQGAEGQN
ncbi:MAG: hypothetical protein ACK4YF_04540 [Exilispira sp.]